MDCLLCHPLPGYEVWESMHWRLAVNRNQNTLGKCFLILRRHDEDICDLTPAELTDLWAALRRVRDALRARFQPDRFNYSFLMNQDRHVHLHVIPRYDAPRAFAGMEFLDRDPVPPYAIPDPVRDQLVTTLRKALDAQPSAGIPPLLCFPCAFPGETSSLTDRRRCRTTVEATAGRHAGMMIRG